MKTDKMENLTGIQAPVTAPKGKFVFVLKWAAVDLDY